jgi:transposase-like protein
MTQTTPPASIRIPCPHCKALTTRESGGSYPRKNRHTNGVSIVRVKRYRCSQCHRALPSHYPAGVHRHKWYSGVIQALFTVLDVHQVKQACQNEIATVLGYPICASTRDTWSDTRAYRATKQHHCALQQLRDRRIEIECGSIDEFKIGLGWAYTLTDTQSQAVLTVKTSLFRAESVVKDLIAVYPPKAIISDGCPQIEAGAAWWSDIPHGRCWFHVMQAMSKLVSRDKSADGTSQRQRLMWDLQFLLNQPHFKAAERFLKILRGLYDTRVLEPLTKAWPQLRLRWVLGLPTTNNTSESLYNAVWARARKRVVKTADRTMAWLTQGFWRWNHHLVRGRSPWERLTGRTSEDWLQAVVIPLARVGGSTHF